MKLRGEEARRYLAENPDARYSVVSGSAPAQAQQPRDGFFKTIAKGLVEPFVRLGEGLNVNTERQLAELQGREARKTAPLSSGFADINAQAESNPTLNALKGRAGLVSFAVGGGAGKGVTALAKAGAVSGALGGFSASDKEDLGIIEDIGKGALFGGATGGAIGVGSKALSNLNTTVAKASGRLAKTPIETRASVFGIKSPNTPTSVADKLELETSLVNTMDEFNLPINTPRQAKQSLNKAYDSLAKNLDNVVSSQDVRIGKNAIYEKAFDDAVLNVKTLDKGIGQKNLDFYRKQLFEGGTIANPKDLMSLKFKLQSKMSPIYTKLDQAKPLTDAELVLKSFHDAVDSTIRETVPESSTILKKMSDLHRASPDIVRRAEKGVKIGVSPFGVQLGDIDLTRAVDKLTEARSMATNNAPAVGQKALDLFQSLSRQVPQVPTQVTQTAPSLLSSLAGGTAVRNSQMPEQAMSEMGSPMDAQPMQEFGAEPIDPQQYQANVFLQLIASGMKPSDANSISEAITMSQLGSGINNMQGGTGMPTITTDTGAKAYYALSNAQKALDILNSDPSVTGKTQRPENIINRLIGRASPASAYETQLETARSAFLNLMAGQSLTDSEMARYEKSLPTISDSPAQARQRLEILISEISPLIR